MPSSRDSKILWRCTAAPGDQVVYCATLEEARALGRAQRAAGLRTIAPEKVVVPIKTKVELAQFLNSVIRLAG